MKVGDRVKVITKRWGPGQFNQVGRIRKYPAMYCSLPVIVTFADGNDNGYDVADLKILEDQMYFQFPKKGISNVRTR